MNSIKGGSKGNPDITPYISAETYEALQNINNKIITENKDLDKKILDNFNLRLNNLIKYFIDQEEAGEDPNPDIYEMETKKIILDLDIQINKLKNNNYKFGDPEFKAIYDISELSKLDITNNSSITPKSDRWFNRPIPSFLLKYKYYCDTNVVNIHLSSK